MHEGIGGKLALISIEDTPVFVKKIRLTDTEKQPENIMSTANLNGTAVCVKAMNIEAFFK